MAMTPREKYYSEIGLIALRHNLTRHDVLSKSRQYHVVRARQHCYWHFRQKIVNGRPMSYPEIARLFGRDHSTVIHGIDVHIERLHKTLPCA
jgi:chromosomal replication initiation ATPase DnaA